MSSVDGFMTTEMSKDPNVYTVGLAGRGCKKCGANQYSMLMACKHWLNVKTIIFMDVLIKFRKNTNSDHMAFL